jgi:hypothetical protein
VGPSGRTKTANWPSEDHMAERRPGHEAARVAPSTAAAEVSLTTGHPTAALSALSALSTRSITLDAAQHQSCTLQLGSEQQSTW